MAILVFASLLVAAAVFRVSFRLRCMRRMTQVSDVVRSRSPHGCRSIRPHVRHLLRPLHELAGSRWTLRYAGSLRIRRILRPRRSLPPQEAPHHPRYGLDDLRRLRHSGMHHHPLRSRRGGAPRDPLSVLAPPRISNHRMGPRHLRRRHPLQADRPPPRPSGRGHAHVHGHLRPGGAFQGPGAGR